MKRFFNLLIAIVCFALVINGIVSGRIGGLQKSGAGGMAIQETDPGYFWLTVIALTIAGILLVYKARKSEDK